MSGVINESPAFVDATPVEFLSREQRYEAATRKILALGDVVMHHSDVSNFEEVPQPT